MPTEMTESNDIRVKIVYNGEVQITYITAGISVDTLREEMRTICGFGAAGPGSGTDQFTMKWVDDEGDPCRIASQQELDEALRLFDLEKDTEITIHVFPNVPPAPGMPCQGEDTGILRVLPGSDLGTGTARVQVHPMQVTRSQKMSQSGAQPMLELTAATTAAAAGAEHGCPDDRQERSPTTV